MRKHHSVNLLGITYLVVHIRKMIIDFLAYACVVLVFAGELNDVNFKPRARTGCLQQHERVATEHFK
jgi:hypothetical protein